MTRTHALNRRTALGVLGASVALPHAAFAGGGLETLNGAAFGTGWRVVAPGHGRLAPLRPQIDRLFAGIDALFSPWRSDSAVSQFNAGAAGTITADPALIEVTGAALEIAQRSDGAFDPTVGPLVAHWGFGPIASGGGPDWRGLGAGPKGLHKARADLTLDLCGIAKGWALDRAAELLAGQGLRHGLVDLGGEYVALGHHPEGRDWRVAVEAPVPGHPAPAALRLPAGAAVATSGTRAQSYALQGRLYSHIVDPRTQAPVFGDLRSVTVVSDSAMDADGWATALLAAGDEAGPEIAAREGIAALFVFEQDGALRQLRTGAMGELIL